MSSIYLQHLPHGEVVVLFLETKIWSFSLLPLSSTSFEEILPSSIFSIGSSDLSTFLLLPYSRKSSLRGDHLEHCTTSRGDWLSSADQKLVIFFEVSFCCYVFTFYLKSKNIAHGWVWTTDLSVNSRALCRLSYASTHLHS